MKCPKCGYENKDDAHYCGMCYEPLQKFKIDKKKLQEECDDLRIQTFTNPNCPLQVWLRLGEICLELERKEEAVAFYEKVLEFEHGHPEAVRKLRQICDEKKLKYMEFLEPEEHFFRKTESLKDKSFFEKVLNLIQYPLRKKSIGIVMGGAVFLNVPIPIVGPVAAIFMVALIVPYMLSIIRASGAGKESLPDWPDFSFFWGEILAPNFRFLGIVLIPVLCYFRLPDWRLPIVLISILFFPAVLMILAASENFFRAINPLIIIILITRIWKSYFIAALLFYALLYVDSIIVRIVFGVPYFGQFINSVIGLYTYMVCMRVIGLVYYDCRSQLGW